MTGSGSEGFRIFWVCNELFMQSQRLMGALGALRHHSSDCLRQRPSVGGYASQFARCAHPTRRLRRGRIARDHEYATSGLHEYRATFCYNRRPMNKGLICLDECYAIRGAIYEVHNEMGSGFKEELTKEHRAQLLNYLRLTNCKMGLLVNFASYPKATVEQWAL